MELFSLLGILVCFVLPLFIVASLFNNDCEGWGALAVLFWVIGLILIGGVHFWLGLAYFLITNPTVLIQYAAGYVGIGVVWAFIKWIIYGRDQLKIYRDKEADIRKAFADAQNNTITPLLDKSYAEYVKGWYNFPPEARQHKSSIVTWMAAWPFSFVATFCADFVGRFFRMVFNWIKASFDHVMGWIWSGTGLNVKN